MSGYRKFFLFLFLAALVCCAAAAFADDAAQLKYIPGEWTYTDVARQEGDTLREADLVLTLKKNGEMSLRCSVEGSYAYSYAGIWMTEFVPDALDRLTLWFTSTDNPAYAGTGYNVKCIYDFYTESWVENDTWHIYVILEENASDGVSPFESVYGYNNLALDREQQPNMRVVRCKDFVSLRLSPSSSSERLAKVPLGALVLALPEVEERNGFTWCTYQDEYGYILSEYLEPVSGAPASGIYGLAVDKLATRTGPGTQYEGGGTYSVKGEYIRILSRAYDKSNGIWWVKCEIPYKGETRVLWTGWKRFDHNVTLLEEIPVDPEY